MQIQSPSGRFTSILSIGIGGSALGPQFVAEALAPDNPPLKVYAPKSESEQCTKIAFVSLLYLRCLVSCKI